MADGDATIRLDQGGINARLLANEAKVDFRRVESASRKIQATFHSPEVKRLFVRYLNSMQLNMYLISVIARIKLPHEVIEQMITMRLGLTWLSNTWHQRNTPAIRGAQNAKN